MVSKKKNKKKKVFTKIESDFSAGFVRFRLVGGDASLTGAELFEIEADFSAKIVTFRLVGGMHPPIPPLNPPLLETTCFWAEKTFEFRISAEKSVSISVKTFFFYGDHLLFRKKSLNFRPFREVSSQFSDKPCETDSRTMKIRVKVVCTFLTLSK